MAEDSPVVLAIDLGGTFLGAALITDNGTISALADADRLAHIVMTGVIEPA